MIRSRRMVEMTVIQPTLTPRLSTVAWQSALSMVVFLPGQTRLAALCHAALAARPKPDSVTALLQLLEEPPALETHHKMSLAILWTVQVSDFMYQWEVPLNNAFAS